MIFNIPFGKCAAIVVSYIIRIPIKKVDKSARTLESRAMAVEKIHRRYGRHHGEGRFSSSQSEQLINFQDVRFWSI